MDIRQDKLSVVHLLCHPIPLRVQNTVTDLIAGLKSSGERLDFHLGALPFYNGGYVDAGTAVGFQIKMGIGH